MRRRILSFASRRSFFTFLFLRVLSCSDVRHPCVERGKGRWRDKEREREKEGEGEREGEKDIYIEREIERYK